MQSLLLELWAVPFLISQVAGIKGMFLANKKTDNQVKTHITYNRGRDWRLLQAPSKDLRGNSIHCVLVSICERAAFIHVFVCARFHQREALTGVDWSQQQWEAQLRKSSARQSWVLWGCWAERSAILIQSNKLTSHLRNTERKRCLTAKQTLLFFYVFLPESLWKLGASHVVELSFHSKAKVGNLKQGI